MMFLAEFLLIILCFGGICAYLLVTNKFPYQKKARQMEEKAQNMEAWANHYKSEFEAKEKEFNDFQDKLKLEEQQPYFLNTICCYRMKDNQGKYYCEAYNNAYIKDECPKKKDEVCLYWAQKAGKVPCRGINDKPCRYASIMSFNDYQVSLMAKGFEGLCYQCAIDKAVLFDPPLLLD